MYVPLRLPMYFINSFSLSHLEHQRFLSTFCFMPKKKSIFSKVPTLTSADIDGKQPHQCSLSTAAAWNVGCTAMHLIPYYSSDGTATGRLKKGVCVMTVLFRVCVCVCGPCVCIHFLPICCAPSMLLQILHPNHNYNVISRIRQCPCCCFTLSFSPLLWISNAVTLSSKSCTARSQTGVWRVCFYRLGWGRGLSDSTFLQFLTVKARKHSFNNSPCLLFLCSVVVQAQRAYITSSFSQFDDRHCIYICSCQKVQESQRQCVGVFRLQWYPSQSQQIRKKCIREMLGKEFSDSGKLQLSLQWWKAVLCRLEADIVIEVALLLQ